MKTVLLLGGPAAGQRHEVHGVMTSIMLSDPDTAKSVSYKVVPMCSHGEVHWFGVLDGADPLALLIDGYDAAKGFVSEKLRKGIDADADRKCATGEGFRP